MGKVKIKEICMKKVIFAAFLLPALLVSCKGGNKDKDYQVTREVFEHEANAHTVLFESNYQITTDFGSTHFINEIDYGKVIVNVNNRNAFEDLGDQIKANYLNAYGDVLDSTIYEKEYFYNMWFGDSIFLFNLNFDDFRYDKSTQSYVCGQIYYDENHVIESGILQAYKNKPKYIEFTIRGVGTYKAYFSRHGEINIPYNK